jgi:CheY-like chemotaxis protein
MAGQPPLRILIIDDEPGFASGLARLLCRDGATVETASDGQVALVQLHAERYDIVLCDLLMPTLNGPDLYAFLKQHDPALCQRTIFLTGDTLGEDSGAFLEKCGQPWRYKPCTAAEIRNVIQEVLRAEER